LIHTLASPFSERFALPHSSSLLPFIKPVISYNWDKLRGGFWGESLANFLSDLSAEIFFGIDNIMDSWRLEVRETDISEMAEACLADSVIFKENAMPLDKSAYIRLYYESLASWIGD
jgi:alcohol dehydrogenase class IV